MKPYMLPAFHTRAPLAAAAILNRLSDLMNPQINVKTKSPLRAAVFSAFLIPVAAQAGLVSYQALDSSAGLTLNNEAAVTTGGQGKFGEALILDGVDDSAQVNAGSGVTGGTPRTTLGFSKSRSPTAIQMRSGLAFLSAPNAEMERAVRREIVVRRWTMEWVVNPGSIGLRIIVSQSGGSGQTMRSCAWRLNVHELA